MKSQKKAIEEECFKLIKDKTEEYDGVYQDNDYCVMLFFKYSLDADYIQDWIYQEIGWKSDVYPGSSSWIVEISK